MMTREYPRIGETVFEEVLDNGGNPVREDQVQKKMIFELIARKGY